MLGSLPKNDYFLNLCFSMLGNAILGLGIVLEIRSRCIPLSGEVHRVKKTLFQHENSKRCHARRIVLRVELSSFRLSVRGARRNNSFSFDGWVVCKIFCFSLFSIQFKKIECKR